MGTVFGRCYWTCNIQTIRSYRTIGLSNSDIVLIPNTPYKTLPPTNCTYQHRTLNNWTYRHSSPCVRPYTDRQHRSIELNCSPWQHNAPHQHPFHTHLHLLRRHRHDTRMDTVFGRCYWTCNIQTIRSYRTIGLSNSDIVLIPNTPYKTPHLTNCMFPHHRLNTMMLNHSLPYVRPYTDQRHKLTELSCSLLQYIYPQIRLFGIATRMFYRLLYLQYNCPDNCSEHHWRNTLHPYIVTDRYALLMFHQLNNIHWTQYNEHRHCNNSCFHRTRIVPYALLTFRQWNNIQPLPYYAPVHWTIR